MWEEEQTTTSKEPALAAEAAVMGDTVEPAGDEARKGGRRERGEEGKGKKERGGGRTAVDNN